MPLGHTGTYRGKKVLVILKTGERIVDHFYERTKTHVILRERGKIHKEKIRVFSIYNKILDQNGKNNKRG